MTKTSPTSQIPPSTRVLLVGVDDYQTFSGEPQSSYDLRGSRTDVVLLAWYCREVLGIPSENIHVLIGPAMTDDDLQKHGPFDQLAKLKRENIGEATANNVSDTLGRLLDETKEGGDEVLFAFSGHGAWTEALGPVLCMGDTTSDLTSGVLPLKALRQLVSQHDARARVVAILDCCHVAGPEGETLQATSLPHAGTAEDVKGSDKDFNVSERVILASKPGKPAYQMRLGMHAHGALTFSLVTAAERWRASDGLAHGSYKRVLKKTKKLVKALGVKQSPAVLWKNTMKEPFLAITPGPVSRTPDAVGRRVEIDGGWKYAFILQHKITGVTLDLAWVIAAPSDGSITVGLNGTTTTVEASQEGWYVNTASLASLNSNYKISVTKAALSSTSPQQDVPSGYSGANTTDATPYISCPESVTWGSSLPSPTGTYKHYKGTPKTNGDNVWMCWDVSGSTLHQVVWVQVSSSDGTVQPTSFSKYTFSTSAPTGSFSAASSVNS